MNKLKLKSRWPLLIQTGFVTTGMLLCLVGCTSKYLKIENEEKLKANDEFSNAIQISNPSVVEGFQGPTPADLKDAPPQAGATTTPVPPSTTSAVKPSEMKEVQAAAKAKTKKTPTPPSPPVTKNKTKKTKEGAVVDTQKDAEVSASPVTASGRQPDLEDSVGFLGRRPAIDPFRVGEEVVHDVRYFKMQAGSLKIKVEPFVQVNQRKAYTFAYEVETSSLFSSFYSVQDRAVVLVDFFELIPRVFTLHVKESAQLREARSIFNFDNMKATFWEKKYTKKNGHEEKKEEWDILPYSQNVFSAAFYMRTFQWSVGKEIAFRVSDNKENLVFKGKCVRRETLETAVGVFDALVIKPEITLQGKFKPVGDIFIWLSNDDRKYILRIESSIKIGTIVSEITKLNPGQP